MFVILVQGRADILNVEGRNTQFEKTRLSNINNKDDKIRKNQCKYFLHNLYY